MKNNTIIGGYMIDVNGRRNQLPSSLNPSILIINNFIKNVSNSNGGVVVLRREPIPEIGPEKLDLYIDSGKFLIMLGCFEEDGSYRVRTLNNNKMPNNLVCILGEKYPAKAVVRDISIIFNIFDEFSRSGDVSINILS